MAEGHGLAFKASGTPLSLLFFFSSRRRHTRCSRDWSSDVCSSDLKAQNPTLDWRAIKNLLLAGGDSLLALSQTITGKRLNAYGSMTCASQPIYARLQRSEEHTSELQSRLHLVCRLLLEKKKQAERHINTPDAEHILT